MKDVVAFETGGEVIGAVEEDSMGAIVTMVAEVPMGGDGGYSLCSNYLSTWSLLARAPPTKQM